MDRFVQRYKDHAATKLFEQLAERVKELSNFEAEDEGIVAEAARFSKVASFLQAWWKNVDPHLLSEQVLQNIQGPLNHAISNSNSFISDPRAVGYIQKANDSLDGVTAHLATVALAPALADQAYSSSLSKYSEVIGGYQAALKKRADEFEEEVRLQIVEVQEQSAEYGRWISEKASETEDEVTEVETQLSDIKSQIETQRSEFLGQFQSAQESNRTSFETLLTKATKRIDDHFIRHTEEAGEALMVLQGLKINAETVFGVVQNTVQAGAHQMYAEDEHKTANRYRLAAIVLMFFAVAFIVGPEAIGLFQLDTEYIFDIDEALKRALLSGIIFVPALYLARESSSHRKQGFANKKTELTLRTLDPYLALITDNTRKEELKMRIAEGIFGGAGVASETPENTAGTIAQITALTEQLSKATRRDGTG